MYIFLCSCLARFIYSKPRKVDVDEYLEYYFRCNSTLVNENTMYNVDCRYDEDLSAGMPSSFTRNEDATMACSKVLGYETGARGVSQNSDLKIHCCKISKDSNSIEC